MLEMSKSWTFFSIAAICGSQPKQKSVINTARKDSLKIIHLFETFSIQVLSFPHSERVNRILLVEIHHLNVVVFWPGSRRKCLYCIAPEIKSWSCRNMLESLFWTRFQTGPSGNTKIVLYADPHFHISKGFIRPGSN